LKKAKSESYSFFRILLPNTPPPSIISLLSPP
jgi:hypothetical protein